MVQTKSPPLFDPCTRQGFLPFFVFLKQHPAYLALSSSLARWKSRCLAAWDGVSLNQIVIQSWLERCKAKLKLAAQSYHKCCLQPTSFGDLHTLATCLSQRCHFFSLKKICRSRDYSYKPYYRSRMANIHKTALISTCSYMLLGNFINVQLCTAAYSYV